MKQMQAQTQSPVEIVQASTAAHIAAARELFLEYGGSLGFSLCFQSFDQELAELPGKYAPPKGRLLLAFRGADAVGCVALRPLPASEGQSDNHACEMKRLYVRPAARGMQLGRRLVEQVIAAARTIGYRRMRLDTVPGVMDAAIALYREMGFREIEPYCINPMPGTLFLELEL